MLPKKTQVRMTFLTSFLTFEQVIVGPLYFHKPVLLKSPGNWSALRVGVYQHWVRMFTVIFLQFTLENQGENKHKTILQTHITRETLLSGRFSCLKTIFSIFLSSFGSFYRSSFWAMVMQNTHWSIHKLCQLWHIHLKYWRLCITEYQLSSSR